MKNYALTRYWIFVLIIINCGWCASQENLTQRADNQLIKSDSLFDARKFKSAIEEAKKALPIYQRLANEVGVLRCHNIIGYGLVIRGKFKEGKENLDKSLTLLKVLGSKYPLVEALTYEALGKYCNGISDFDCALKNYEKSVWILKKKAPANHLAIAENHISLAVNNFMTSTYKIGEKHLDTVLSHLNQVEGDILEPLARYYANSAYMKHGAGHFKEAIPFYELQIATHMKSKSPNKLGIANAYGNLGGAYNDLWNFKKGQECIEKSLKIFIEEQGENNYNVSHNYLNLARIYSRKGEGQKALDYNKRAITINEKIFPDSHYNIGMSYEALASTYSRLDDYENELLAYFKCLKIFKSIFGEKHKKIAILYENIGRVKRKQGNLTSSIEYLSKAIEIGKEIFETDNVILASMYQNLAESYYLIKEYSETEILFDKAHRIRKDAFGSKHLEVAESNNAKALYLYAIGEYEAAIQEFDQVLNVYAKEVSQILNDFYVGHEFYLLKVILQAFEGKANCLNALYQRNGDNQYLEKSIVLFEKAQVISHKMRQVVFDYRDRNWVSEYNQSIPEGGVEASYLHFENSKDPKFIEKAFGFLEESRSNTLRDFIEISSYKNTTGSFGAIVEQESELKAARSSYISNITEVESMKEIDSSKLQVYKDGLFRTNLKYDSLIQVLRKENPAYFNIEYNNNSFNLSSLQGFLDNETSFLEFFQVDSTIYTLVVTKNDFTLKKKVVPHLVKTIKEFKTAILDKNIDKYIVNAQSLYSELIEPISTNLVGTKLIISPHNDLWNISFDLLLTEVRNTTNARELPYLLNKYAVSYANSARTLVNENSENKKELIQECLAFSYTNTDSPAYGKSIALATLRSTDEDLPGSRKEIKAISNIVDGQYYYGQQANEATFKINSSKYAILHLALHGEVDENYPENSKLHFSSEKDSIEDNILYSHELFSLDVPAELAVLSACSTGNGKVSTTEGIMSLGSAFQYAGTKSLLLTSWEVSDETAPPIMEKFYANLKKGMDKASALQQAKLQYLKESDVFRTDPFYWGSFYLVGDISPLNFGKSYFWLYALLTVFSIALFAIYVVKLKKK